MHPEYVPMKVILFAAVLALASLNSQAAEVTASTDRLALPPTLMPGNSDSRSVTFTNETAESIDVYGTGAFGPFSHDWNCSGGTYVRLPAHGTCTLQVRFRPREGQPLGLAEGLVGFRLATGTMLVDLVGFSYTNEPLGGLRNLLDSVEPLGFIAPADAHLRELLEVIEGVLRDGRPNNDRSACGRLGRLIRLVEHEAAAQRVSDWSAVAAIVQAQAVGESLGCRAAR